MIEALREAEAPISALAQKRLADELLAEWIAPPRKPDVTVTTTGPDDRTVIAALALIPISILPVLAAPGMGSVLYVALASLLGFGQLVIAAWFWRQPNDLRARVLLRASLVYLPTVLVTLMLTPWI